MKSLLRCAPLALVLATLAFPSCDLETVAPAPGVSRPADHLVINEVFTLPRSNPNAYSWVELYNPTDHDINLMSVFLMGDVVRGDTTIRMTLPLIGFNSTTGELLDTLQSGHFLVVVTDSIHFNNHTNVGPGKGNLLYYGRGLGVLTEHGFDFLRNIVLAETNDLMLMDTTGTVLDDVRFGNYVYRGSADPRPGNHSAGIIPDWSSLSRYAGAYYTGNTADDFYMESKPIPNWYSQLNHP